MKFKDIEAVEAELKRFDQKLKAFCKAQYEMGHNAVLKDGRLYPGLRENGALRRAAHDLKVELTKITQGKLYE